MAIKYKWLAQILRDLAEQNRKKGIIRLPTEQELCRKYHLSRQTVRQALSLLEAEGIIEKKQGSGTFLTGSSSATDQITILISSENDYIYPRVLEDIRSELHSRGFSSQVSATENRTDRERSILLSLLEAPPKGVIAEGCKSGLPNPNLDLYLRLLRLGTPVVFLYSYYPEIREFVHITDDNQSGSSLLVHLLCENGHTCIGGIFQADDIRGHERFRGFTDAMTSSGLEICDKYTQWFDSADLEEINKEKSCGFLKNTVARFFPGCTAVICHDDRIAYRLILELQRCGFRVPEDVSVASFDNTYLSTFGNPTITSLSHRPHEMGRRAAQTLIEQIRGLPVSSQEVPWKLNIRESTALTLS